MTSRRPQLCGEAKKVRVIRGNVSTCTPCILCHALGNGIKWLVSESHTTLDSIHAHHLRTSPVLANISFGPPWASALSCNPGAGLQPPSHADVDPIMTTTSSLAVLSVVMAIVLCPSVVALCLTVVPPDCDAATGLQASRRRGQAAAGIAAAETLVAALMGRSVAGSAVTTLLRLLQ